MAPPALTAVVVPTHNRIGALEVCLAALDCQTTPPTEVIVVDDGSDDATGVVAVVAGHPRTRLVRQEPPRGPAAARNVGWRATDADAVLFTDDDCEPDPRWVSQLSARIRGGADAVAGVTVNARRGDRLAEASQVIANSLVQPVAGDPGRVSFAPSSNIACRRDVLVQVPFDETYLEAAGEDRDWCARITSAGYRLELEPHAVVRHHHALDLHRFWTQQVRYGRAARRVRAAHPSAASSWAFPLRLVASGFGHGPAVGAYVALAQVAAFTGYLEARARRPPA